jgi:hypothetical protein
MNENRQNRARIGNFERLASQRAYTQPNAIVAWRSAGEKATDFTVFCKEDFLIFR